MVSAIERFHYRFSPGFALYFVYSACGKWFLTVKKKKRFHYNVAIQATSFYTHSCTLVWERCRNGALYIYLHFFINVCILFGVPSLHLFTVLTFCFFLVSYSTGYMHLFSYHVTEIPLAFQLVDLIWGCRVRFAGNVVVRGKFCWMHNFAPSSSTFMSFAIRQLLHNAFSSAYTGRSSWTATESKSAQLACLCSVEF